MLRRDVVLSQEYLAFLLLNLFDLFLTGYIFRNHGLEANGAARFILQKYGLVGLPVYKFLLVIVLILACEGIAMRSIRIAKLIMTAGCVLYTALVFWEVFLIITQIHMPRANSHPNAMITRVRCHEAASRHASITG